MASAQIAVHLVFQSKCAESWVLQLIRPQLIQLSWSQKRYRLTAQIPVCVPVAGSWPNNTHANVFFYR